MKSANFTTESSFILKVGEFLMIIIDESTNNNLTNITILLAKNEIIQMIGYLKELLLNEENSTHYHLNNDNYSKEITLASYEKNGCLDNFSEKHKNLILSEE